MPYAQMLTIRGVFTMRSGPDRIDICVASGRRLEVRTGLAPPFPPLPPPTTSTVATGSFHLLYHEPLQPLNSPSVFATWC